MQDESPLSDIAKIAEPVDRSFRKVLDTVKEFLIPSLIKKRAEAGISVLKEFDLALSKSENIQGATLEILGDSVQIRAASRELLPLEDRARIRTIANEERKQKNLEGVIQKATFEILDGKENELLSEVPVDPDWTARFINIAEDISNDDALLLWGRILAGEARSPGTFSLRTLDLLKNISQKEALLFKKFARLIFNERFIYFDEIKLKEFNIVYDEVLILEAAGLLQRSSFLVLNDEGRKSRRHKIHYNGRTFEVYFQNVETFPPMPCLILTPSAIELSTLIKERDSRRYWEMLHEFYKAKGFQASDYSHSFIAPPPWGPDEVKVHSKKSWGSL